MCQHISARIYTTIASFQGALFVSLFSECTHQLLWVLPLSKPIVSWERKSLTLQQLPYMEAQLMGTLMLTHPPSFTSSVLCYWHLCSLFPHTEMPTSVSGFSLSSRKQFPHSDQSCLETRFVSEFSFTLQNSVLGLETRDSKSSFDSPCFALWL